MRGGDGVGHSTSQLAGGGGGGGRIGVHLRHQNNYGGLYTTEGGQGYLRSSPTTAEPLDGSAGTMYKYESRRGPQYRELKYRVDNTTSFKPQHSMLKVDAGSRVGFSGSAGLTALPTMVMEDNSEFYEFDEIQLHGVVSVLFYHPTVSIVKIEYKDLGLVGFEPTPRID